MTISTIASSTTLLGNGSTRVFNFSFIADAASDIQVTYTDTLGNQTLLNPSLYTLVISPPAAGEIWGIGGLVTYPLSGPVITAGTSLTIERILPLTQNTSISNQGDFYPTVVEAALDTLEMQIQQVSARTGQMRGTWVTGISYNTGDMVTDGANGTNTLNIYICVILNTSGVWATDLAAGDWSLALNVQNINKVVGAYLPLAGGTISGSLTVTGNTSLNNLTVSGTTSLNTLTSLTVSGSSVLNALTAVSGNLIQKLSVQTFTVGGTYTPTAGMAFCIVEGVGAGGGSGGVGATSGGQFSASGGGGGGGYFSKLLTKAQIGASQAVTIGAAGAAGTAGNNNGGAGGDTLLGLLGLAKGGAGGSGSGALSIGGGGGQGGAGGAAGSGVGDTLFSGGTGDPGIGIINALVHGGDGGGSFFGLGGNGLWSNIQSSSTPGYGGGGGGVSNQAAVGSAVAGNAGGAGYITITEFLTQ